MTFKHFVGSLKMFVRKAKMAVNNKNTRLYVGNINSDLNKQDIKEAFEVYGPLSSIWIYLKNPQFAFVEFMHAHDADMARTKLNGKMIKGCCLKVDLPRERTHWKKYAPNENQHYKDALKYAKRINADADSESEQKSTPKFYKTRTFYNSNRYKNQQPVKPMDAEEIHS